MNNTQQKIYSREFLQGLQAENRKRHLKIIVERLFIQILNAAARGDTSILIQISDEDRKQYFIQNPAMMQHPPTFDEMIEIMREHFPDSKIQLSEQWVETNANTQVRKKGIFVDWS